MQGVDQSLVGSYPLWRVGDGQFQVSHHRREMVVEMVGDGSGHASQSFSLLKLTVLDLEFHPVRLLQLAFRDVAHHRPEYGSPFGLLRGNCLYPNPERRGVLIQYPHLPHL